jgi:GLPGLI family protein
MNIDDAKLTVLIYLLSNIYRQILSCVIYLTFFSINYLPREQKHPFSSLFYVPLHTNLTVITHKMKTSRFAIAVFLAFCSIRAMAQLPTGVDTLTLDKVNWRITYTGKVINDTTQETPVYRQAEMRLDIGDKVTYFYNQSQRLWEKQVIEMIMSGGAIDLGKAEPVKAMTWDFLKNYPEEGKTYYSESWKAHTYHCVEPTETPDWEIVPDSTTAIAGYNCQLAKANFKGRTWWAWYTEDIPIPEGPWKLCGLPGLILRAYDEQRQYIFEGIGLEDIKGSETMKYAKPDKTEPVTQSDLTKIKHVDDGSESLRDVTVTDANGKAVRPKAKRTITNPIER